VAKVDKELPLWRRARRRAYWLLLVGLLGMAAITPRSLGRGLCRHLARLALRLRGKERVRGLNNLERAFPEMDPAERERLLRRSADLLGENLFDALAAPRLLATDLVRGPEGVDLAGEIQRLLARGRGLFILTGHLGCWELLGGWLGRFFVAAGHPQLGVVTGTLHNPAVDGLVQGRRRDMGLLPLPRERGARPLLRHLGLGSAVAVLLDQNTRSDQVEAPFFGHPAPTPAGLARLALRYGVPVLPLAIARLGDGHQVQCLPAIEPPPAGLAATEEEVKVFTSDCNESLEELIRRNPAEWVWFHDRWGS
jgi:KDO2-lipid IV(A) lauroyltransferase